MPAVRLALGLVALSAGAAVGQPPPPVYPEPSATDVLAGESLRAVDCGNWRTDLIVGLPTAVRFQRRVGGAGWIEAGAGLLAIFPDLFVGARADLGLYCGRRHTFAVRPGVDGHVLFNPLAGSGGLFGGGPVAVGAASVDVDFVWQARWTDSFHGVFGLKLGAMAAIRTDGVVPVPVAGLLVGLQY
jgi:hypothetical protein